MTSPKSLQTLSPLQTQSVDLSSFCRDQSASDSLQPANGLFLHLCSICMKPKLMWPRLHCTAAVQSKNKLAHLTFRCPAAALQPSRCSSCHCSVMPPQPKHSSDRLHQKELSVLQEWSCSCHTNIFLQNKPWLMLRPLLNHNCTIRWDSAGGRAERLRKVPQNKTSPSSVYETRRQREKVPEWIVNSDEVTERVYRHRSSRSERVLFSADSFWLIMDHRWRILIWTSDTTKQCSQLCSKLLSSDVKRHPAHVCSTEICRFQGKKTE